MWQWCFLRSAWWKKTFQVIYQKLALFYIVWEIQILAVFKLVFLNESDATCGSDAVIALRWILHKLLVNYALEVLVFIFCPLNAAIILNNTWYNRVIASFPYRNCGQSVLEKSLEVNIETWQLIFMSSQF